MSGPRLCPLPIRFWLLKILKRSSIFLKKKIREIIFYAPNPKPKLSSRLCCWSSQSHCHYVSPAVRAVINTGSNWRSYLTSRSCFFFDPYQPFVLPIFSLLNKRGGTVGSDLHTRSFFVLVHFVDQAGVFFEDLGQNWIEKIRVLLTNIYFVDQAGVYQVEDLGQNWIEKFRVFFFWSLIIN
jgi:hypothetical protein